MWDAFTQKLLATPEFKAFMSLPEYKDWKLTGEAVKKHFNQVKEAAAARYGWTGPKTGNLSDLADCPTKAVEHMKAIWLQEEEEREEKASNKELRKDLDETQNHMMRQSMSGASIRNRNFYNLEGQIVDSKGKKKMKMESITPTSAGETDGSRGASFSSTSSSSSRYASGSRFNPFDVDSLVDFVNNRHVDKKDAAADVEQKKLKEWEEKILKEQRLDAEQDGLMSRTIARFASELTDESSKRLFSTMPFQILQKKFTMIGDSDKQDEYITHLTRLGISYADAYRFLLVMQETFSEIESNYKLSEDGGNIKIIGALIDEF